jgi:LPS sulfotransferase NodH
MFKSGQLLNVFQFINECHYSTYIIYDDSVHSSFIDLSISKCLNSSFVHCKNISDLICPTNSDSIYFCLSLKSEKKLIDQLKAKLTQNNQNIFGFFSQLLPTMIAITGVAGYYQPNSLLINDLVNSSNLENLSLSCFYAILCTPRSGSSFLCSVLENNGFGIPKEHLRNELPFLIKYSEKDNLYLKSFFETVVAKGANQKCFGTKVIAHFLEDLIQVIGEEEQIFINYWIPKFKILYLYRADKVLQAISIYRAQQTKLWHRRNDKNSQILKQYNYNFLEIDKWYQEIIQQEEKLLTRIISLQQKYDSNIISINYEQLSLDAPRIVETEILPLLSQQKSLIMETDYKQIHGEVEMNMAEKFEVDYQNKYFEKPIRNFSPTNL